jgi:glycosyltransferase involved in cell wall biosynthesis
MMPHRPLRVLHVLGQMNPGGVESWLLNVFRTARPDRVAFDVMVHQAAAGAYDAELQELGIGIHRNTEYRSVARYYRRFREIAAASAGYDVVHSHVHHYSAVVLACAAALGIPARIAHSHNDTQAADRHSSAPRRAYLAAMRQLLRISATKGIACSGLAAAALFGEQWESTGCELLYCGIDPARFAGAIERAPVRREFGIPREGELVIHVGRYDHQKNHSLLVDAFAVLAGRRPSAYLVLVGGGPLEDSIRARTGQLGIEHRVRFCGRRADVPRLLNAADVFAFPSHHEGLPLSCLEAQAAGLPLVISDRITPEVIVVPDRVTRLPLGTAESWAAGIEAAFRQIPDRDRGMSAVAGSPFDIHRSTASLLSLYSAQFQAKAVAA